MKTIGMSVLMTVGLLSSLSISAKALTPEVIMSKVVEINRAQNVVLMKGSTKADLDQLFSLKTEDFTYIHEKYGGTYSRDTLYGNYLKRVKNGQYTFEHNRYEIVHVLTGENTAAIQRLQTNTEGEQALHLVVFEFDGDKVSRMVEYW